MTVPELRAVIADARKAPGGDERAKARGAAASYQLQKNIAMSLSVFALTLVAIPLGIRAGRRESYANVALALCLSVLYFFLMAMTGWLENKPSARADLLVHLPNLFFQFLGAALLARGQPR